MGSCLMGIRFLLQYGKSFGVWLHKNVNQLD